MGCACDRPVPVYVERRLALVLAPAAAVLLLLVLLLESLRLPMMTASPAAAVAEVDCRHCCDGCPETETHVAAGSATAVD